MGSLIDFLQQRLGRKPGGQESKNEPIANANPANVANFGGQETPKGGNIRSLLNIRVRNAGNSEDRTGGNSGPEWPESGPAANANPANVANFNHGDGAENDDIRNPRNIRIRSPRDLGAEAVDNFEPARALRALEWARSRGWTIRRAGGRIEITGPGLGDLTPEAFERIEALRLDILKHFEPEPTPAGGGFVAGATDRRCQCGAIASTAARVAGCEIWFCHECFDASHAGGEIDPPVASDGAWRSKRTNPAKSLKLTHCSPDDREPSLAWWRDDPYSRDGDGSRVLKITNLASGATVSIGIDPAQ